MFWVLRILEILPIHFILFFIHSFWEILYNYTMILVIPLYPKWVSTNKLLHFKHKIYWLSPAIYVIHSDIFVLFLIGSVSRFTSCIRTTLCTKITRQQIIVSQIDIFRLKEFQTFYYFGIWSLHCQLIFWPIEGISKYRAFN